MRSETGTLIFAGEDAVLALCVCAKTTLVLRPQIEYAPPVASAARRGDALQMLRLALFPGPLQHAYNEQVVLRAVTRWAPARWGLQIVDSVDSGRL
ncbi:jg11022 [Pararge aegeria aegeria]|uniref:Jg11022 protein n=1 Tax=Pararge aegeria aegeria TaxID=348720 RepID=A0A8S4SBE6_9NEOP|nr:jg11022 [Pararge aegeria aegeria]